MAEERAFRRKSKKKVCAFCVDKVDNIDYKEWILIFATLPTPFLKAYEAIKMAEEVIEKDPTINLANTILQFF